MPSTQQLTPFLTIEQSSIWDEKLALVSSGKIDVYYTASYFKLLEDNGDGEALCFVFEEDNKIGFYPFFLKQIPDNSSLFSKTYYDLQGAYGYNGVLFNTNDENFHKKFYAQLDQSLINKGVIAEFIRINPVNKNAILSRPSFDTSFNQKNIVVDLKVDDIFQQSFDYSTRKNVRKAERNGLRCEMLLGNEISLEKIESFYSIYKHTMQRNDADDYYYFSAQFFHNAAQWLNERALFVFIYLEDKIISCELVLCGDETAYSYLGGTNSEFFPLRPNDFLKFQTILYLQNKGLKNYCLGGGSEGIIRYKKSFDMNGERDFFIGKKIHNTEVFQSFCEDWEKQNPDKIETYGKRFLKYRF